ncbi:MAG TPA: hypothetical protein VNJ09_06035 [Chthonomonadales bacterium]|nr:hypothetical protein [Chthonomonadales bacterium]
MESLTFQAPRVLRNLFGSIGVVCLLLILIRLLECAFLRQTPNLIGLLVLSLPCWYAAAVLRKRVIVSEDGLYSTTLLGSRFIPWETVRYLDQKRASFVVETDCGSLSSGWLAPSDRERLMRLILQFARLGISTQKTPWGVIARYAPRAQTIPLGELRLPKH